MEQSWVAKQVLDYNMGSLYYRDGCSAKQTIPSASPSTRSFTKVIQIRKIAHILPGIAELLYCIYGIPFLGYWNMTYVSSKLQIKIVGMRWPFCMQMLHLCWVPFQLYHHQGILWTLGKELCLYPNSHPLWPYCWSSVSKELSERASSSL